MLFESVWLFVFRGLLVSHPCDSRSPISVISWERPRLFPGLGPLHILFTPSVPLRLPASGFCHIVSSQPECLLPTHMLLVCCSKQVSSYPSFPSLSKEALCSRFLHSTCCICNNLLIINNLFLICSTVNRR